MSSGASRDPIRSFAPCKTEKICYFSLDASPGERSGTVIDHKFSQRSSIAKVCPLHVTYMNPQALALEHRHDFLELVIILTGRGEQFGGLYKGEVRAGDVFLIPCGVSHGYRNGSPDLSLINVLFLPNSLPISPLDISLLPGFRIFYTGDNKSPARYPGIHVEGKEFQEIAELAKKLYAEYQEKKPGRFFCCIGIFMQLLCRILRLYALPASDNSRESPLSARIFTYLNSHYREEVTLTDLCRISRMSRSSLMRYFVDAAGCSPIRYLIRLRISEAMRLLCFSSLTVAEIAWQTGFRDNNYFCRQFKQVTDQTPLGFRKEQLKKTPSAPSLY